MPQGAHSEPSPSKPLGSNLERGESMPIAIVVVCLNTHDALEMTLANLVELADNRVRTIVVDGGSSDRTAELLELKSALIYSYVSESDDGIYDAMNKGWQRAPEDAFVLYLGAGDRLISLPPQEKMLDEHGQPRPVILGDCMVGTIPFSSRWGREMWLRNTAHHQALMIHKSVSPRPPFDATLRVYGDWDFNLRLLRKGVVAHRCSQFVSYAEPGGVSWQHNLKEIRLVARRHGGPLIGLASWALNLLTVLRMRLRT